MSHIKIVESAGSKAGVQYEVANGHCIPNRGQKEFVGTWFRDDGDGVGISRPFIAQVTDVNKNLLSVPKLEEGGYSVLFDGPRNSWIRDGQTGEKMYMTKVGKAYQLSVWVREDASMGATSAGFAGQGVAQ